MNETNTPALLEFSAGEATIQAAASSQPRISGLCYGGGIMVLAGQGPVAIDIDGMELPGSVPLLVDHANKMEAVAGAVSAFLRNGKVYVEGIVSLANQSGQRARQLARDGVPLQLSVGAEPTAPYREIRPGETFTINGQTLEADSRGVKLFPATLLREVSLTPNGADSTTVAVIQGRKSEMAVDTGADALLAAYERIDAFAEELSPATVRELKASVKAGVLSGAELEAELTSELKAAFRGVSDAKELASLRASAPKAPSPSYGGGGSPIAAINAWSASVIAAACGETLAEKCYGERALEASREYRGMSVVDGYLTATGAGLSGSKPERLRAAMNSLPIRAGGFSTIGSLPVALGDSMSRVLEVIYRDSSPTWRQFASIKSADTFHEQTAVRPSAFANLSKIGAQGEVKHDHVTKESTYKWKLDTFSKTLAISRQHLINDWLGFFDEIVSSMGPAGMRTLADLVYEVLLGATGSHFHASYGNLNTSNTLSLDGFSIALKKFREIKDERGHYIDLQPAVLLVPPALETTAKGILSSDSTERIATAANIDAVRPTGNPLRQAVRLEVEPRLSGAPTTWYLLAGPQASPMAVGFLGGKQSPTVEFFGLDASADTLGVQWRVTHDFGAALGDFRAAQKNTA